MRAPLGDRVRERRGGARDTRDRDPCRRRRSSTRAPSSAPSCAARVDAEREPGHDRRAPHRDSARANARAFSMPCGVALRLPTIASAGRVQELAAADEVQHRRRIGRARAAPADNRGRPRRRAVPGASSHACVRASERVVDARRDRRRRRPGIGTTLRAARVSPPARPAGPPNARSSATIAGGGRLRSASAAHASVRASSGIASSYAARRDRRGRPTKALRRARVVAGATGSVVLSSTPNDTRSNVRNTNTRPVRSSAACSVLAAA